MMRRAQNKVPNTNKSSIIFSKDFRLLLQANYKFSTCRLVSHETSHLSLPNMAFALYII
jgi:hypothetical protein